MSLGVAILCGIIYWLAEANLPFVGLWTLQRPLVCGFLTGCLLGQPVTGAVVGATINWYTSDLFPLVDQCLQIWHWQVYLVLHMQSLVT